MTADLAEEYGLGLASYHPGTKAFLKTLVPSYGSVNNPFDMTAEIGYNTPVMVQALQAISRDDNVDAICVAYTITPEIWDMTIAHMVEAVTLARREEGLKPVFWLPFIEHTRHCRLAAGGVAIPPQAVAATADEAVAAGARLGYPLSVKIHSADIAHKSDVGGVRLNVKDEAGLREAFASVMASCAQNAPQAKLEGVLLKPMLKPGVEMIIGVNSDRDFGPMLMVGLGGVFVELFKDVRLAPAPVTKAQALRLLGGLKSYPLLTGYRGGQPCDVGALADLLVRIGDLAAREKETLRELDLNPVFATPGDGDILGAQSDYYLATRGGGHGDYRLPVLAPADGQEIVGLVPEGIRLAYTYRTPVLFVLDGTTAQTTETADLPGYRDYSAGYDTSGWAFTGTQDHPKRALITGSYAHEDAYKMNERLRAKCEAIAAKEQRWQANAVDDAELIVVAFGIHGRMCKDLVAQMRPRRPQGGPHRGLARPPGHTVRAGIRHGRHFEERAGHPLQARDVPPLPHPHPGVPEGRRGDTPQYQSHERTRGGGAARPPSREILPP